MEYTPQIFRRQINNREHSSFLYIRQGTYHYRFLNDNFTAHCGELVYLPRGGNYRYEVIDKNARCLQIELDIADENGKYITFSDTPQMAGLHTDEEMELHFYPHGRSEYIFREDDGISLDYLEKMSCHTKISCEEKEDKVIINIGKRCGEYSGKPKKRDPATVGPLLRRLPTPRRTTARRPLDDRQAAAKKPEAE